MTKAQTFTDVVADVNKSVVTIQVLQKKNLGIDNPSKFTNTTGMGSGVLLGEQHLYILTATHVVADASKNQVVFANGTTVSTTNRRIDRASDVALLQLTTPVKDIPVLKVGDSEKMRIGDDIFIIGNPLGLEHSVSRGIISGFHIEKNEINNKRQAEFFQTDASRNKGNSGGPMFNLNGEGIGIVSSILSFSGGFEGLNFAATSSLQKGRIWFRTDVIPLCAELCKLFNVPQEEAIMVQGVAKNSPAYFMELKGAYVAMQLGDTQILAAGDLILQFDDIPLNSGENLLKLSEYLNHMEKGKSYTVKIIRAGEIKHLSWRIQ